MTASGVFVRPILLNIRYSGIASAVVGTITAPSTNQNSSSLPRNANFANPYPAAAASSAAPIALTNEYTSVLRNQSR